MTMSCDSRGGSSWWSLVMSALCIWANLESAVAFTYSCEMPEHFIVKTSHLSRTKFHGSTLNVTLNERFLNILTKPTIDFQEVIAKDLTIEFAGMGTFGTQGKPMEHQNVSKRYYSELFGLTSTSDELMSDLRDHCSVMLLPNRRESLTDPVASKIHQFARVCIQKKICSNMQPLRDAYRERTTWNSDLQAENILAQPPAANVAESIDVHVDEISCNAGFMMQTVNNFVDVAVHQLFDILSKHNRSYIALPNFRGAMNLTIPLYTTEVSAGVEFGTLGDLSTIRRAKDVVLSSGDSKYEASVEFRADNITLRYDTWKIVCMFTLDGFFELNIPGITVSAQIAADYSVRPCVLKMSKPKISDMELITFDLSGFGSFLNWILKAFINVGTMLFHYPIVWLIEYIADDMLEDIMAGHDCEAFRP